MLDGLTVRDFYIPMTDYPHIESTSSVCKAIVLMYSSLTEGQKYRTILVTDEQQHLMGYLSLRDLIRAVGPKYLRKKKPQIKGHQPFQVTEQDFTALSLIWQEGFTDKIREEAKQPVADVMTLVDKTVTMDDPFAKCVYLMLAQDVLILPVVEDEKVTGVVRLVDAFDLIADNLCKDEIFD
jgi:Mg/Co/Ni transporter MgtE